KENQMAKKKSPIRIPISNVLLGNDYTGRLYVGSERRGVDLLLDTGSSSLAVGHKRYDPRADGNVEATGVGDGGRESHRTGWIGSVVQTDLAVAAGRKRVDLAGVSVAVAYHGARDTFGDAHGILGLAYQPLDDAVDVNEPTVPPRYTPNDFRGGQKTFIEPYF